MYNTFKFGRSRYKHLLAVRGRFPDEDMEITIRIMNITITYIAYNAVRSNIEDCEYGQFKYKNSEQNDFLSNYNGRQYKHRGWKHREYNVHIWIMNITITYNNKRLVIRYQ